jgi:diguanylate cyclase (GGDEF)-like protein
VGTYGSLHRVRAADGEISFEEVALPDEIRGSTLFVEVAPDGTVWTGGPKGLARFDGARWMHFGAKDGLRSDSVTELAARSGEEVWVLYRNLVGLTRMRLRDGQPETRHFGAADGFPSDTFYAIGIDSEGRIWTGGNSGVSVLGGDGAVRTYDRHDGLVWDDLSGHGFLAEPDGSFFLGTSRGLAHYRPAGEQEPPAPRVVITSVTLGGRTYEGDEDVSVGYEDRDLSLAFACATFRNPSAVRFRTRLVGMDAEPVVTGMREIRYSALPWGRYRFEVECLSARGRWSENPAAFSFAILPPWWVSWWAVGGVGGLAVVAVLALVFAIVSLRTRKLRADRSRLEAAVAERSRELARANEELQELSFTDVLTGTRNRRYFMNVVEDDVSRVLRRYDARSVVEPDRNRGLIFLIVDIDWFKKVNDTHGHRAGDEVLAEVGRRLQSALRASDLLVRWGGEEFLVVCRDAEPTEGGEIAKRILDAIGREPFEVADGRSMGRTCSVGWAPFPWSTRDPGAIPYEPVLELADKALYEAKGSGRNTSVGVLPLERGDGALGSSDWIARSLGELEGTTLRLVRTRGPVAVKG